MLAAKNFQSGMQTIRQLEFALFDFRLHMETAAVDGSRIQSVLDEIRSTVAVVPAAGENRFQHSFGHIFGGGYAAGYYSYKWAEVLSADAFSRFREEGIFNRQTGERFLEEILEVGGSVDAMDMFVAFRGREPDLESLLRQDGIIE
jgi:oligopeptidase A